MSLALTRLDQTRMAPAPAPRTRRQLKNERERHRIMEQFRRIYLSVQPRDGRDQIRAIGVTSAQRSDGRTSIAAGIATVMAADLESPVVLVEVDFANPGVHRAFGVESQPGICEYLRRECDLAAAVRQVTPNLFVLPAGDARGEGARLVHQLAAADLRGRLDTSGALLVFDLPPVLDVSYGAHASTMAEGLIFVVRAGKTQDELIRDALLRLPEASVRAVALNNAEFELPHWARGFAR